MKILKNFLSAFLAVCILAGLLPAEALADFAPMPGGTGILGQVLDEQTGLPPESGGNVGIIASGDCGVSSGVTWVLDSNRALTISGNNVPIPRYYSYTPRAPWYDWRDQIHTVVIETGITGIGNYAFCDCSSLTSITIPDSVTSIGDYAFEGCSSLSSITIPSGVTSIQWRVFCGCSSLTSITIPDNVTSIGSYAFYGCSRLTGITIPSGVTSIGDYAFYDCSSLSSITIPNGVTRIGDYAFYSCSSLTSITIPDRVTNIGSYAFYGCSRLTDITIPDSVTSTVFPNGVTSFVTLNGVTCIGDYAFYGCSSLTSITIPDRVTSIGNDAFYGCSNLTSITIPDNVTRIGNGAFYGCSSLTSITIPDNVTRIENDAFYGCSSLTSITIPDNVTRIGNDAFYGCSSLTSITIPDSVTSTGARAFHSCSSLTSITIPDNVTYIGDYAFHSCSRLTNIIIPSGVTSIGWGAFQNSSLKDVYYGGSEVQWKAISIASDNSKLASATIHYNSTGPKEGLIITGTTATNCLKKSTTFEMYVAYYRNDAIDLSAKDFIVVSDNSEILSLTVGGWDNKKGRQYTVTAKRAGSCSITFTNPQDGGGDRIDFNVIDGEAGYTFDGVPKLTIEEGKTTNFYNFCGMIVNDFAYTPHEDVSGSIDYYDVTMTVYNSKNLYGAVTSYQADGEIYSFAVIDKHASYSTSFTDDVKELINSVGDLYYQIKNDSYYSGKSISTETPIKIRVPVSGYLQISNSFNSEIAGLANVIGLLVDGTVRTAKLVDSSGKIIGVDNASGIVDAVLQESMDTLEEVLADNFVEGQMSGKIKSVLQKSFKTGTWNLNNYGECVQSFLDNSNELGIDLLGAIAKSLYDPSSMMSIAESVVNKVIPTGNLISFLYSLTGMADASLFWLNFKESVKFPSGIFIYAPSTSSSYQSNGVNVTPAQKDNHVTVHAYRVVDTADVSGNKYETYSVNMYRDGQKVQPDAPVSVQIPLMSSYNKGSVKVYRINDDGTATNMNATVENGYAVFTTDHFSYYALVDVDTNGVFLSRWTSEGRSVVTLSDPDEATSDAIICAATYDDDGKMTDIMFGERFESGANQIQATFPGELGEGWELYILAQDHAPICPGMTLQAPSKR